MIRLLVLIPSLSLLSLSPPSLSPLSLPSLSPLSLSSPRLYASSMPRSNKPSKPRRWLTLAALLLAALCSLGAGPPILHSGHDQPL
ncbi:MAG: hypothetical protein HUU23_01670, partial [Caldilineales bacterium]|nr:hypothetical protein [Caldilineales bacterium]